MGAVPTMMCTIGVAPRAPAGAPVGTAKQQEKKVRRALKSLVPSAAAD